MLKSKKFWSFEVSQAYDLTPEIISNYKLKNHFFEDALYFFDLFGTGPHPSFKQPSQKEHNIEPTVLSFQNILVDLNTLKIIFILIPTSKVTTLKFSSNNMTIKNMDYLINSLLTKPNNIYHFSFEWNDKIVNDKIEYSIKDIKTIIEDKLIADFSKWQELQVSLTTSTRLESICLRGNLLGNEGAIKIFESLKNQNSVLRILNLYKNALTNDCIKTFCEMMLVNRKLEEINFGNNSIGDDALEMIKNHYGKFVMSQEEVDAYNKQLKERQEIINKNNKARAAKKPEIEVPYLDEMVTIEGVNYILKNATIKVFTLIQNKFTPMCFESLLGIMNGNDEAGVTIDYNSFLQDQRDQLNSSTSKYANRIYLLK